MSSGFSISYFSRLAELEPKNFWFNSRNRMIVWALKKYFKDARDLMELGCGTGFVLSAIRRELPAIRLSGSDAFEEGLVFAQRRVPDAKFYRSDAETFLTESEFDLVTAFDVLEHIENDEQVLNRMHRAVRGGGGILITVPQHPSLWSRFDEFSRHVRRYTASELIAKVEKAGFEVVTARSFVSLLWPLLWLSRREGGTADKNYDGFSELKVNPVINFTLESVLHLERGLIASGISFPFGGSLLLAARKVAA